MKIEKMKKRKEFLLAANSGKVRRSHFYVLQGLFNNDIASDNPRVGFTASKKSIGCAVKRNFAKRRMRAALIPILKEFALPSTSYVIIARNNLLNAVFADFKKSLHRDVLLINKLIENE